MADSPADQAQELLGLDLGRKYLGLARINRRVGLGQPLAVLAVNGLEFGLILDLINQYRSDLVVVGQPGLRPEPWWQTWTASLRSRLPDAVPIVYHDELLTTDAARQLAGSGDRQRFDDRAAVLILEDYLGLI